MQRTFSHAFLSKATLIAMFTLGAVAVPATAVRAQPATSPATAQSTEPTLALSASASETVAQDTVTLTLTRELRGENQVDLSRSVNEAMNKIRDKAKSDKDLEVRTGSYQVWFERDNNRPVEPAAAGTRTVDAKDDSKADDAGGIWVARGELLITSKNMEKASQFAADVDEDMALDGIRFSLSREARETIEKRLLAATTKAFKTRAQDAVTALEFGGYRIKSLRLGDVGQPESYQPRMMAMRAAKAGPAIEAGKETVTLSMEGAIFLLPK
ncbi:MAG: SIMPL domain-containing protein [Advenella sp.]|uniref:SIMPL domain-containing protein n=1 Tax=Advenella sp. TaxID=1872388 RepID=UPI003F9C33D5